MNNLKKYAVGVLAAIALILSIVAITKPASAPVAVQTPSNLGSVSGPDLYSPYFNVNGVKRWFTYQGLQQATTTPCSIKSPVATSTLLITTINLPNASSTAATITIATSTTQFATTTPYATYSLAANSIGSFNLIATSTSSGTGFVVPPSSWLVYGISGTALTTGFSFPKASCTATFQEN